MTEIIREIDEELQAKRYKALAIKYAKYIIPIILAVIVGFGGYAWYGSHSERVRSERAADFARLAEAENTDADAWLDYAEARPQDAFSVMAQRFAAAAYAKSGKTEAAAAIMRRLAEHKLMHADERAHALLMADILDSRNAATAESVRASSYGAFAALAEAERLLQQGDRAAAIKILDDAAAQQDIAMRAIFSELSYALQAQP